MHESDIDDSPSKIIPSKTRTPTTLPRSECEKIDTDERMDVFKFIEVNCFCPFKDTPGFYLKCPYKRAKNKRIGYRSVFFATCPEIIFYNLRKNKKQIIFVIQQKT